MSAITIHICSEDTAKKLGAVKTSEKKLFALTLSLPKTNDIFNLKVELAKQMLRSDKTDKTDNTDNTDNTDDTNSTSEKFQPHATTFGELCKNFSLLQIYRLETFPLAGEHKEQPKKLTVEDQVDFTQHTSFYCDESRTEKISVEELEKLSAIYELSHELSQESSYELSHEKKSAVKLFRANKSRNCCKW